ncbi:MAG: serine/threonine protein kinase, partial [Kiritimatiellae bacterium]|nr:serine/threonine protein kinase [Kiritimatiellia bacterium]
VWKAHDLVRGEIVAVKILNRELTANEEDIDLFQAEAKTMSEIDHVGIVRSYELNCHRGVWYFTMEYVDGYNFNALLARKQHLCEADCLLICESVAIALGYAWNDFGVVHCDVKPDNIMINTDGVVKITDLGLCHTFQYLQDGMLDVPDHVMGTPAYISPEQVYGDLEPDCRADIYSLAASLYHLATGRMLFPGLDNESMMRAHCDEAHRARDPRFYRPELSEGFCQLLEAMLVKNRDYRLSSWNDVCTMCLAVEQGVAFKPRQGAASSLELAFSTALKPTGAAPRQESAKPGPKAVPQPKKNVFKLLRDRKQKAGPKIQTDPESGRKILFARPKPAKNAFKVHQPVDW